MTGRFWNGGDTYGKAACFLPYEPWTLDEALRADITSRVAGVESAVMMPGPYNSYCDANDEMVLGECDPSSAEAVKRAIMETGTRPGGLPSTGDLALAYASLAAAGAIISLVLAYFTANRPCGRAADGDR